MKKIDLIDDFKSPLFRIMSVFDSNNSQFRIFCNNVCAFHIGNGYILSVAHNLRIQNSIPPSIPDTIYTNTVFPKLLPQEQTVINSHYPLNPITGKRHFAIQSPQSEQQVSTILSNKGLDFRYITFYDRNICSPHLIVQFRENAFYGKKDYSGLFPIFTHFDEPALNRHTFIIKLKLVDAFYDRDYALYKIDDEYTNAIQFLPAIGIDYSFRSKVKKDYYCLQPAPADNCGRLLNIATIDGIIDHHSPMIDLVEGNYTFEGLRYLISGYFRFGSSGAPYLKYNKFTRRFAVNAIQSEASPIQLTINNERNGNFQYVNAIASPISSIKRELRKYGF
jgi:hypothetical protein